jgi:hypothetical protein
LVQTPNANTFGNLIRLELCHGETINQKSCDDPNLRREGGIESEGSRLFHSAKRILAS